MNFHYTDSKELEMEIEKDEYSIFYKVGYVHDFDNDTTIVDEVEVLKVVDTNGDVIPGFYDEHKEELYQEIITDAKYHEPCDWSRPSWSQYCEAKAEWEA